MPRAAVGVAVRQRTRERAMRGTTLLGRRGPVDRRPRQDVAELDAAVAKCDEADCFGRDELLIKPGHARSSVCNSPVSLAAATRNARRVGSGSDSARRTNPRATLPAIGTGASIGRSVRRAASGASSSSASGLPAVAAYSRSTASSPTSAAAASRSSPPR